MHDHRHVIFAAISVALLNKQHFLVMREVGGILKPFAFHRFGNGSPVGQPYLFSWAFSADGY
jgi:hypothetical protein